MGNNFYEPLFYIDFIVAEARFCLMTNEQSNACDPDKLLNLL